MQYAGELQEVTVMEPLITKRMLTEYDSVVAQLATRAEDLTSLDGTFVETIYPEKMEARQHQIIYGRRGAGKTHLLRRVEFGLRESFVEGGILPIYVNGSQLSNEISINSTEPVTVALAIYVQLMQHIGAEVHRYYRAGNGSVWPLPRGHGRRSRQDRYASHPSTTRGGRTTGRSTHHRRRRGRCV
jgi:hypothetical protein